MKKVNIIASIAVAGITLTTGIAVANASEQVKGTWHHGYTLTTAYSEYYLPLNSHGSKVVNINNAKHDTANQIAGAYSHASIGDVWDPASFYYSNSPYKGAAYK